MELESAISKVASYAKKPVARLSLAMALTASSGFSCTPESDYRGYIVEKIHQDEVRQDSTIVETDEECVVFQYGRFCRWEDKKIPAIVVDDEDWILKLQSCKNESDCSDNEVVLFVDKRTFESADTGYFIDLTGNKSVSTKDPNKEIRK